MDTKALKDKILQLAIQGKLVPQDENDEPASVLLERIKEEKKQLIKNKVIKKEKPLQEISEEEKVFELPNGWKWCRISEIVKVISGKSFNSKDFFDDGSGNKSIKITNVGVGTFIQTEGGLLPIEFKITYRDFIVREDDIIMALTRPFIKDGLKICRCPIEYDGALLNQRVAVLKDIYTDKQVQEYLFLYLSSDLVLENIKENCNIALQPNLSINTLMEMIIPIPPLEEQKRIVAKVDALFKLIDELDNNKQDLLQNISNSRNKVLQLAIQGKLVSQDENAEPASVLLEKIKEEKEKLIKDKVIKKEKSLPVITDDEKSFELPNGWEWCRLGELGICQTGTTPSTTVEEYFGGDIPFIKPADISSKGIDYENDSLTNIGLEKGRKIPENSLVMVCIGGSIGKNYFTDRLCSCNQQINGLTPLQNIDSRLLHYICSSQFFYNNLIQTATGTATPIIKKSNWEKLMIPLPPLKEQRRIVAKVDAVMSYLNDLEKHIK